MRELESFRPETPNVVLYDANGLRAREGRIWFSGAARVHIGHVAVTDAGNIIAAGYVVSTDAAVASFIAKTDLSGKVAQVVRTNPFVPKMVCAASDGTVWSFGHDREKHEAKEDYAMLRQYSFDKGLLREYLPRQTFPPGPSPALNFRGQWGAYLRCTKDGVALYVNQSDEYIELLGPSNTLTRWPVGAMPLPGMKVLGFAVTDSGQVYGALSEFERGLDLGWTGLYELERDARTGEARWLPVPGTLNYLDTKQGFPRGAFIRLWGTDGKNLIITQAGQGGLAWALPLMDVVTK